MTANGMEHMNSMAYAAIYINSIGEYKRQLQRSVVMSSLKAAMWVTSNEKQRVDTTFCSIQLKNIMSTTIDQALPLSV